MHQGAYKLRTCLLVLLQFQQPSHKTAVRMPVALAQVVTGVNVRPTEEIGIADRVKASGVPRPQAQYR